MQHYYIGVMSGTSMDSIDAALVLFENKKIKLIDTLSIEIPVAIKTSLNILLRNENIPLKLFGEMDTRMGKLFASAVLQLLKKTKKNPSEITAIGSHGHTLYHHPNGDNPFTIQIGDPNIIAAHTNITTISDFRRRDMALGGQGAPLVPAFHEALFGRKKHDQYIVNIGGIANVTFLPNDKSKPVIGFDTGPGNTLLDLWHQKHQGKPIDFNGAWARNGAIIPELLAIFLADPYFKKSAPKSTGREYFNLNWLDKTLTQYGKNICPEDVQATLTELTAQSIMVSISHAHTHTHTICGGGAYNTYLMERLGAHCADSPVQSTESIGIDPKWIEAMAFSWLAKQTMEKKPGNLPSVTGATKETILGGVTWSDIPPCASF